MNGVDEYSKELQTIVTAYKKLGTRLAFVTTTPAHNVNPAASHGDDTNKVRNPTKILATFEAES